MKIERIAPILTVDDLGTAITEHTGVLGMQVVMNRAGLPSLPTTPGVRSD